MNPSLQHQLERYAVRLAELDFLLSREDIMRDMTVVASERKFKVKEKKAKAKAPASAS